MENLDSSIPFAKALSGVFIINGVSFDLLLPGSILILLIIGSGLVSGSEVAFFSIKGSQYFSLRESSRRYHRVVIQLLQEPRRLLGTILIINNLINIAIIILFTTLSNQVFDFSNNPVLAFFINVVAITFILVLLGEVIPKVYANQANLSFATFMAFPMLILSKAVYPLSIFLVKSLGALEQKVSSRKPDVSMDDLKEAIEITANEQSNVNDKKMLQGIVNFSNITVKQIMTFRVDTVAYSSEASISELIEDINHHRYSRIPVYKETFDNVHGILYIKDLAPYIHEADNFNWLSLLRKPYFVPENKKIDDLLREFQAKKVHMAIVVDEYGGSSGIITMEDILEEIVGEIQDEFDDDNLFYSKLDNINYVFDGKTPLHDLTRILEIDEETFEPYKQEVESIGGLMVEFFGRIPQVSETINYKQLQFTIESADRKKVRRVKVTTFESKAQETGVKQNKSD